MAKAKPPFIPFAVRAGFAAVTPLHGIARADLRGAATAASAALETR